MKCEWLLITYFYLQKRSSRPNLKNLNRGLNIVCWTWHFNQLFVWFPPAQFGPVIGGSAAQFKFRNSASKLGFVVFDTQNPNHVFSIFTVDTFELFAEYAGSLDFLEIHNFSILSLAERKTRWLLIGSSLNIWLALHNTRVSISEVWTFVLWFIELYIMQIYGLI